MEITIENLKSLEVDNLISVRPNTDGTLLIANYTPKVQYERLWTDLIMQCRGLIIDTDGNVVARGFGKFFNIEEHQPEEIPKESFEVFDKMDGSLGIAYHYNGWKIATRGSFSSEQAIRAQKIFNSKYKEFIDGLNTENTYLFEIIYPENRIVVDYGASEKLVLLAIKNVVTGDELSIDDVAWADKVVRYDGVNDISTLRDDNRDNSEGFVIKFSSGFRVKLKYAEYVRLHRIITGVSNISIWEYLRTGQSLDEIIKRVPDEFYDWVKRTKDDLEKSHGEILKLSKETFKEAPQGTRKDFALWAVKTKHPSLLFLQLDGKSMTDQVWKILIPTHSKPFKIEE